MLNIRAVSVLLIMEQAVMVGLREHGVIVVYFEGE